MSADTWGISGPAFLTIYLSAAAAAVIVALAARAFLSRGQVHPGWEPDGEQLAHFLGGPQRATFAALAGLRTAGAITTGPGGVLVACGRVPPAPSALTWAVYQAAQRGVQARKVAAEPDVRAALDDIRQTLVSRGWLLSPRQQSMIRSAALPLAALGVVGVGRVLAGMANDRPVVFVVIATIVVMLIWLALLKTPGRTRSTGRAVATVRARNLHLNPRGNPAFGTYGAADTSLAVGLFGATVLWAADPAFAAETGLTSEMDRSSGGGDSGSGGGGGDGGGGGCGGGGGGGGCGG